MTAQDPDPEFEPVATGDRREEAHLEPDKDQLVRAHFLIRPAAPPPPDEHTGRVDEGLTGEPGAPVEDLRVAPLTPSVWDARPLDDADRPEPGGAPNAR
jgi:hypothetical protein